MLDHDKGNNLSCESLRPGGNPKGLVCEPADLLIDLSSPVALDQFTHRVRWVTSTIPIALHYISDVL